MYGMSAKDRLALFEKKSTSDTKKGASGPKKIGKLNVGGDKDKKGSDNSGKSAVKTKKEVKKEDEPKPEQVVAANGVTTGNTETSSKPDPKPEVVPAEQKEDTAQVDTKSTNKNKNSGNSVNADTKSKEVESILEEKSGNEKSKVKLKPKPSDQDKADKNKKEESKVVEKPLSKGKSKFAKGKEEPEKAEALKDKVVEQKADTKDRKQESNVKPGAPKVELKSKKDKSDLKQAEAKNNKDKPTDSKDKKGKASEPDTKAVESAEVIEGKLKQSKESKDSTHEKKDQTNIQKGEDTELKTFELKTGVKGNKGKLGKTKEEPNNIEDTSAEITKELRDKPSESKKQANSTGDKPSESQASTKDTTGSKLNNTKNKFSQPKVQSHDKPVEPKKGTKGTTDKPVLPKTEPTDVNEKSVEPKKQSKETKDKPVEPNTEATDVNKKLEQPKEIKDKPVEPKATPTDVKDKLVQPKEIKDKPVEPKAKPTDVKDKLDKSKEIKDKPVEPEAKPAEVKDKLDQPKENKDKPVEPKAKPTDQQQPVEPKKQPVETKDKSIEPKPEQTDIKEKPEEPKKQPKETEDKPVVSNTEPTHVKEKPEGPNKQPVTDTTDKSVEPKPEPTDLKEKPEEPQKPTNKEPRSDTEVKPVDTKKEAVEPKEATDKLTQPKIEPNENKSNIEPKNSKDKPNEQKDNEDKLVEPGEEVCGTKGQTDIEPRKVQGNSIDTKATPDETKLDTDKVDDKIKIAVEEKVESVDMQAECKDPTNATLEKGTEGTDTSKVPESSVTLSTPSVKLEKAVEQRTEEPVLQIDTKVDSKTETSVEQVPDTTSPEKVPDAKNIIAEADVNVTLAKDPETNTCESKEISDTTDILVEKSETQTKMTDTAGKVKDSNDANVVLIENVAPDSIQLEAQMNDTLKPETVGIRSDELPGKESIELKPVSSETEKTMSDEIAEKESIEMKPVPCETEKTMSDKIPGKESIELKPVSSETEKTAEDKDISCDGTIRISEQISESCTDEVADTLSATVSDIVESDTDTKVKDEDLDLSAELEANIRVNGKPAVTVEKVQDEAKEVTTLERANVPEQEDDREETIEESPEALPEEVIKVMEEKAEIPESNVKPVPIFKPIPEEFYDTLFYFSGMGTVVGSALAKGVYVPQRATKTALDVECIEDYESVKDDEILKETKTIRTARHQANDLSDELKRLQSLLGELPTFVDTETHVHKMYPRGVDTTMHAKYHGFQPIGKPRKVGVPPLKLGSSDGSAFRSRPGGIQQATTAAISTKPTATPVAPPSSTQVRPAIPEQPKPVAPPPVAPSVSVKPKVESAPPPPAPPVSMTSSVPVLPKIEPVAPMTSSLPVHPKKESVSPVAHVLPSTEFKPISPGDQLSDKENFMQTYTGDNTNKTNGPTVDAYKPKPLAPLENQPKQGGARPFGEYTADPNMASKSQPWQDKYGTKTVEDASHPKPYDATGQIPSGLKPWELSRMRGLEARGYQFSHELPKSGADHSDSFYHGTTAMETGVDDQQKGYAPYLVSRRSQSGDREKKTVLAQKDVHGPPHVYSGDGESLPYSDV